MQQLNTVQNPGLVVILVTYPIEQMAHEAIVLLVEANKIACGTILRGATSIYRWDGELTDSQEVQVLLKTTTEKVDEVCYAIKATHPYDVPEFLVLPVATASAQFSAWVAQA